ncbi:hypothetical protein RD055328_08260 [Companilactobacillus sp. RD055328]|uniref:hypothetical protein n=1 Tax=Companilactobacillus sp. RD055328 TaxID=2916634 RepID=UPI001FC879A0|nr:hypothetical protein [Companilactobacillus sp. RD055328]GKQ42903.1 hypothetical protein RD055328_08260 [Companilactobacillus sp. RD055328]
MKELKTLYFWNEDMSFSHLEILKDGQEIPENATLTAYAGYAPFKYDKSLDKWIGVSKEEYDKAHPIEPPAPTNQDKMNAMFIKSNLEIKKEIAEMKGANNG